MKIKNIDISKSLYLVLFTSILMFINIITSYNYHIILD